MNSSIRLKLAIVAGAALVGAILMSIESATGYLAWHASYRANWSPWYTGGLALLGGAACGLRLAEEYNLSKAAAIAVTVPCALALGTIGWACQVYGAYDVVAHLSVAGAALFGALLLGAISAITVVLAKV